MKIKVYCYGNHNNLHAAMKLFGYKFKLVLFFDTCEAYVIKSVKLKDVYGFKLDVVYNELKLGILNELDFNLKTPKNEILTRKFDNTEQLINKLKLSA